MKYTKLTKDGQQQILEQCLSQYEQEHYRASVRRELLVSSGATDSATEAAIRQAEEELSLLDKVHAEVSDKLESLISGAN